MKSGIIAAVVVVSLGVAQLLAQNPTGGDQYIGPPGIGFVPDLIPNPPPLVAVPIHFTVLQVAVSARIATQREANGKIVHSSMNGSALINLALGQPIAAALPGGHVLALAIGDDSPATYRLMVYNRETSTLVKTVASAQLTEVLKNDGQSLGLLNLAFLPTGNTTDGIRGGSVQFVAQSILRPPAVVIFANGNGRLDYTGDGTQGSAIFTGLALRAGSKVIGTLTE